MKLDEFNHLIPELQKELSLCFFDLIFKKPEFMDEEKMKDSSPLINLTLSIYISSLLNILKIIKENTIGEIQLIKNIELIETTIVEALENLPFVYSIKFYE